MSCRIREAFGGWRRFLPLLLLLPAPRGMAQTGDPRAAEIVARVLERARWVQEQNYDSRYSFRVERISEHLDSDGQTEDREVEVFLNILVSDRPFERLIEKNGRPLTEPEAREEAEREAEFRRKAAEGTPPGRGQEFAIRKELLGRYQFRYQGLEPLEGRSHHLLAFQPRSGKLPVHNRLDRALNQAEGRIWVEPDSYEISRVEFSLTEKVRLWWGLIGTIHEVEGQVRRQEIDEGVWYSTGFDLYLRGRILWRSLHRRQSIRWRDFEPMPPVREEAAVKVR